MKSCLKAGVLLCVLGLGVSTSYAAGASGAGTYAVGPAISAQDAWVREVPPVAPAAALFVRLVNSSDQAQRIRSLSSPVAKRVEWHDMAMDNGQMRMTHREPVSLPPGETMLAPGGSHLMLIGIRKALRIGDAVPVTLSLENGDTLLINAVVRATDPRSTTGG